MKHQSDGTRRKSRVGDLGSVKARTFLPATKTVTVQAVKKRPQHNPHAITVKPRSSTKPRVARTAQRPVPVHVPPQTLEAAATDGPPGAAQARLSAETERRIADFHASPWFKWYRALEDERAERVSETARVVSTSLTEALQRADKAMTLPQLSLAFAAISVEIVSGRRKPDLRGRIERILLDVSEDEFHDERLDHYDPHTYGE